MFMMVDYFCTDLDIELIRNNSISQINRTFTKNNPQEAADIILSKKWRKASSAFFEGGIHRMVGKSISKRLTLLITIVITLKKPAARR